MYRILREVYLGPSDLAMSEEQWLTRQLLEGRLSIFFVKELFLLPE